MLLRHAEYLELYLENCSPSLCKRTIVSKRIYIQHLLDYFESHGIENLYDFDINVVYHFINSLEYSANTISGIEFVIRDFFNFLYHKNLTTVYGRRIFPVIFTNKRDRILSFYSDDEIKDIISQIDINEKNGVRDKCILLLAAQIGLRAGDIATLKKNDIKWDKNLIEKVQNKTGITVSVPIPLNLKLLLIDYIKNHRPYNDTDYVFIGERNNTIHAQPMIYHIVNKYFKKSNVNIGNRKHGPHALRHSLATRLLKENTPMPVITGILGHKNINTTSQYLSIDIEGLRKMSLEVPNDGLQRK